MLIMHHSGKCLFTRLDAQNGGLESLKHGKTGYAQHRPSIERTVAAHMCSPHCTLHLISHTPASEVSSETVADAEFS